MAEGSSSYLLCVSSVQGKDLDGISENAYGKIRDLALLAFWP
jgi:hypothetical protein